MSRNRETYMVVGGGEYERKANLGELKRASLAME